MSKYTVKEGNGGEMVLEINGLMSRCPYTAPLLLPNPLSQSMGVSMIPCSTICPHATVEEAAIGGNHYVLTCGNVKKYLPLTELENKPTAPIIGLNGKS